MLYHPEAEEELGWGARAQKPGASWPTSSFLGPRSRCAGRGPLPMLTPVTACAMLLAGHPSLLMGLYNVCEQASTSGQALAGITIIPCCAVNKDCGMRILWGVRMQAPAGALGHMLAVAAMCMLTCHIPLLSSLVSH